MQNNLYIKDPYVVSYTDDTFRYRDGCDSVY